MPNIFVDLEEFIPGGLGGLDDGDCFLTVPSPEEADKVEARTRLINALPGVSARRAHEASKFRLSGEDYLSLVREINAGIDRLKLEHPQLWG